ncbi:AI-2E family transporter [Clostridium tyrobutyricum]|jgi:predicted PurR-regulated permease PerM|uniref:AI-2E family transporter n=1 Tax=Clostridium tyrobutyricum TaxID=1519 RepID=UPI0002ED1E70|nr:AI-2E family transporter [Clostridium tyrobutyricum]MBR9648683.1 AI-2E family transporter [Clostridium tyrobutyricum]MBV4415578.1 AI-2E family transporter [Clostridium tyrobutyricum]MBV4427320.1 AI-2E family transporter [Clostridium tyrobutyricum]MBV4430143.1 AI-2E family transporter [Clostridium tyrobutyricum]MBV4437058.1 AI-2E family transporter [Clostridium tyrobutyricum]
MDFLINFFSKDSTKRILLFIAIIIFFYSFQSVFNLFLLTFLFAYIMNSIQVLILKRFKNVTQVKENIVTIVLYSILFSFIVFVIVKYIPQLANQTKSLIDRFSEFKFSGNSNSIIQKYIVDMLGQIDIKSYIKSGFNVSLQLASEIGKWSVNIFISIMLSLFFILEKKVVMQFIKKFKYSKISGIYNYLAFFGKNFLNSFGKVIQAQILIALVNTILSVITLSILHFPQLVTLGFMIFVLSLIPVAGVIISLVPLCLIAFNIGGLAKVVSVLIMVAVIHCIESYILNPKLMSSKIKIPIFFTFVILIVSEHILGMWGLLIGIPLFMFILDLLGVKIHD